VDHIRALLNKAQSLTRPGNTWNTQAGSYPGQDLGHAAVVAGPGTHVTFSGTTATVHSRLLFGQTGQGFGSDLS
jgi:hypothetical protein